MSIPFQVKQSWPDCCPSSMACPPPTPVSSPWLEGPGVAVLPWRCVTPSSPLSRAPRTDPAPTPLAPQAGADRANTPWQRPGDTARQQASPEAVRRYLRPMGQQGLALDRKVSLSKNHMRYHPLVLQKLGCCYANGRLCMSSCCDAKVRRAALQKPVAWGNRMATPYCTMTAGGTARSSRPVMERLTGQTRPPHPSGQSHRP
jgi:hypothetical protein